MAATEDSSDQVVKALDSCQVSASTEASSLPNASDDASTAHDDDTTTEADTGSKGGGRFVSGACTVVRGQHELINTMIGDRQAALLRVSSLISRKSLALIDLSQRGLSSFDAHVVLSALQSNPCLSVLKLGYNNLGNEGCITLAPAIQRHPSLTVFDVGFNSVGDLGVEAIATALDSNTKLKTLYLSGNSFGARGCKALARTIRKGCGLSCLHLTGNKVGPQGVICLMQAVVETQNRIQQMILEQRNAAEQAKVVPAGTTSQPQDANASSQTADGSVFLETLPCSPLEELFLGGTSLGSEGCLSVANMLLTNFSLRKLSLADNGLTDSELTLLSQSFARNKFIPLEVLHLSFNKATCAGVEPLMNALWGSKTLREIRLDNNAIRDRGAQLSAVVLSSVPLNVLDLGFNQISTIGIKALMKALAENSSLSSLTLSGTPMDTNSAKAVSYALAFNCHLREFYIDHCSLNLASQRHMAAGIVSNTKTVLSRLTGFPLGAATVTLGFPRPIENWSNDHVLSFIRHMWEKRSSAGSAAAARPSPAGASGAQQSDTPQGLCDPATVVAVAKAAFEALGDDRGRGLLNREGSTAGAALQCPLIPNSAMVLEKSPCGTLRVPSYKNLSFAAVDKQRRDDPINGSRGTKGALVTPPLPAFSSTEADPLKMGMRKDWLSRHRDRLEGAKKQPFDESEYASLDRFFFSSVAADAPPQKCDAEPNSSKNDSGSSTTTVESCPHSPVSAEPHSSAESDSSRNGSQASSPKASGFAMKKSGLQRKLSYRYLSEALLKAPSSPTREDNASVGKAVVNGMSAVGRRRQVSQMSDGDSTSHGGGVVPPAPKRARSTSRLRIDLFPQVKGKLMDLKASSSREEALRLMRQLKVMEELLFHGRDVYTPGGRKKAEELDRNPQSLGTSDAEAILLDLM